MSCGSICFEKVTKAHRKVTKAQSSELRMSVLLTMCLCASVPMCLFNKNVSDIF